jgi:hypothetical protein
MLIKYFFFNLSRHQTQSTTNTKIQATSKDLKRLTVVVRHGDKLQRLQVEKLTEEFRNVVEYYSRSQKVCLHMFTHTTILIEYAHLSFKRTRRTFPKNIDHFRVYLKHDMRNKTHCIIIRDFIFKPSYSYLLCEQ